MPVAWEFQLLEYRIAEVLLYCIYTGTSYNVLLPSPVVRHTTVGSDCCVKISDQQLFSEKCCKKPFTKMTNAKENMKNTKLNKSTFQGTGYA